MPPLPHFRNHSHFVAPDINIESEHKVQAKYNFLIQNKVLPVCVGGLGVVGGGGEGVSFSYK